MSNFRSSDLAVGIVFICGLLVTIAYFVDVPLLTTSSNTLQTWAVIVAGFSLGLGIINMVLLHGKYLIKRVDKKWQYSLVFFIFFIIQSAAGFADLSALKNPVYVWIDQNIFNPLARSMYAILGFFIVTASYRAMRARSLESVLLLVAGVIVMLMNAPIGALIWSGFPIVGQWILDVPSNAVNRAVLIGVGIGSVLYGLRVLLGYERSYQGGT